ncbi:MAG TPA: ATP-binding cassette domain-containing protein, partial [Ilumatobacteraceae bacterium]
MIDLDDVFVLYPVDDRQVAALRGLSLSVAAGERVVVAGPSGSGKSTLVRLVTGLVRPSAGRAEVLGNDLTTASSRAILALQRSGIGTITQQMANNLAVELTGLQNVSLQCRLGGRSRREAEQLGRAMMGRLGVDHLADRSLATISAGEAQRVALAAALAHRPRVIVADEPTGALDIDTANIVFDLLAELSTELDAALLVVSHDPSAGRIGDRVLEIRDGRLGAEQLAGDDERHLVVDNRGWVRLPERDRVNAGITSRARVVAGTDRLTLTGANGAEASEPSSPDRSATAPASHRSLVTATDVGRVIGSTTVLRPTSVDVRAGELLVISGRSGSGKTTLLGLIAGMA